MDAGDFAISPRFIPAFSFSLSFPSFCLFFSRRNVQTRAAETAFNDTQKAEKSKKASIPLGYLLLESVELERKPIQILSTGARVELKAEERDFGWNWSNSIEFAVARSISHFLHLPVFSHQLIDFPRFLPDSIPLR